VSHRKGSDVFLAAAARVGCEVPDVEFRMVGPCPDGSERDWALGVIERAREAGVTWGTTSDPFQELADWHILVLPSRREPFGLVLIEAMAMGLPVVATGIDGPAELVKPETGLLVEVDDPEAVAAAVIELARDPGRRQAMGLAGRARVEQEFTLEKQAEVFDRAYAELAGRCRSRGGAALPWAR
jgi:glycosyltransferase involved in cell wall biosynthesis